MPSIRFIKDATLDIANEDGSVRKEVIKAGTVQHDVKEGTAVRWERRGFAERIRGESGFAPAAGARGGEVITQVGSLGGAPSMPPVPPPPPSPEDAEKQAGAAFAPPPPPPPPPGETPTQPARRGRPNAAAPDGEQGNGDGQS